MRRSAERALGAAQAFAAAEGAYARALATASQIPLTGNADGDALRDMLAAFRVLPQAVSDVHEEVRRRQVMFKAQCQVTSGVSRFASLETVAVASFRLMHRRNLCRHPGGSEPSYPCIYLTYGEHPTDAQILAPSSPGLALTIC